MGISLGKFNKILVFGQFIRSVATVFAKNIRKGDRRNREVTKKEPVSNNRKAGQMRSCMRFKLETQVLPPYMMN